MVFAGWSEQYYVWTLRRAGLHSHALALGCDVASHQMLLMSLCHSKCSRACELPASDHARGGSGSVQQALDFRYPRIPARAAALAQGFLCVTVGTLDDET